MGAPPDERSAAEKRASQEEPAGTPAEKRARLESPAAQPKENVAPNDVQRVASLHRSNEVRFYRFLRLSGRLGTVTCGWRS